MNQPIVLCVEDNEDDVVLLKSACRKSKVIFRLQWVTDGQKAIDYLLGTDSFADRAAHPLPDLLLLDLNMPRKNGFEVLTWLRQSSPPLAHLPVLIFTSSQHESDIRRTYDLGADHYLMKPLDYDDLVGVAQALSDVLSNGQRLEQLASLKHYRARPGTAIISRGAAEGLSPSLT